MPRKVGVRVARWLVLVIASTVAVRAVVAVPEQCSTPSPAAIQQAAEEAVGWFARQQHDDGTWTYRYDVAVGRDLGGYNWVRHAGVMLSLEQAAAAGIDEAGPVADVGRRAILRRLVAHGDVVALEDAGTLTTGGTSLLVAALGERRLATGAPEDDERLRGLGRFLVQQVGPDGRVDGDADVDTGEPGRFTPGPFSTGEAFFALARLDRLFPGEGWGDAARRIADYLVTERAVAEGYVSDLPDHWAAYGYAEVALGSPLRPVDLAWARRQLGVFGVEVRFESQRTDDGLTLVTRGHHAVGAGVGTIGEALGAWDVVAAQSPSPALDEARGRALDRLGCIAGLLTDRQVSAAEAAAYPEPSAARGAWLRDTVTQMDDQQHTLSALLAAQSRLAGTTPPVPRRAPVPSSGWLAGLAALAAFNPLRVGRSGPGRGPVALGAVVGVGVIGLLAAVGGPMLDGLDVSAATGVVAAGAALVVAGVVDAARRLGPDRGEGLRGWAAALVPVLVPRVLRPELAFLAVAAGAGGQGWPVVAGAALGAAASIVVAARARSAAGPVATWLAHTFAVTTLVTGIALAVDGAFAI